MIDRGLTALRPSIASRAMRVDAMCQESGFDLLIYCGLRTCAEQAVLYRQSRPWSLIASKMSLLKAQGFGFLADVIDSVGPQNGPHVTNAAPGQSWHNYGLAFDAVPVVAGKLDWTPAGKWDNTGLQREWAIYGDACRANGLAWAGDWVGGFREYCHAQWGGPGNPLTQYGPAGARHALETAGAL